MATLFVLLPALFVPSTLSDWRVWWLFLASIFTIGVQPNLKHTKLGADNLSPQDRGSVVLIHLVGYCGIIVPYFYFLWTQKNESVSTTTLISIFAVVVASLGVGLRAYAIKTLGNWFTLTIRIQAGQRLIQNGPYHWIRHPSYTGALLFIGMLPLSFEVWKWIILFWPALILTYQYRIRREEPAMEQHFGEDYKEYKRRTWALIPYVY